MSAQVPKTTFIDKDLRNFLTRGFVGGDYFDRLDPVWVVQDPTYLSFKIDFFVDTPGDVNDVPRVEEMTDMQLLNVFGHEGLLRKGKYSSSQNPSSPNGNSTTTPSFKTQFNPANYNFQESAEDYLYSIGSANRIASLKSFKQMLRTLQDQTPWYFQKISGVENLYKVDPNINTRQDALLTFECLESLDMRMSLLADLYRAAAFDFERHREVLPYNQRTFRMRIHILEMRNFNTSFGNIAKTIRGDLGQAALSGLAAARAFGGGSVGAGGNGSSPAMSKTTPDEGQKLWSAFDTVSVQTYELGLCEFDFFSEAPSYLEDVNVNDVQQASFKFKIKYGTVRKTGKYSFYRYLTDYVIKNSLYPLTNDYPFTTLDPGNPQVVPFYDPNTDKPGVDPYTPVEANKGYSKVLQSGFYGSREMSPAAQQAINNAQDQIDLRNEAPNPPVRVGGILGKVLGAAESAIATAINRVESRVDKFLLGNVYDRIPSPAEASQALLGFFNPDLRLSMGGQFSQPVYDPGNVVFDPTPVDRSLTPDSFDPLAVDTNIVDSPFSSLPVDYNVVQSPLETLSLAGVVVQNPMQPLNTYSNLQSDPLEQLPVDTSVTGGGLEPLDVLTTLTQDPLSQLPIDTAVNGGGFDQLPVNSSISPSQMQQLRVEKKIEGGGLEGSSPDKEIIASSLNGTPPMDSDVNTGNAATDSIFKTYIDVDIEQPIIESPMERISATPGLALSPMESAPKPSGLLNTNVNLTGANPKKTLDDKDVNFEVPPKQPQISPKNVFRRS